MPSQKDPVLLSEAVQALLRVAHNAARRGDMDAEDVLTDLYDRGFPGEKILISRPDDPIDMGFFFWDETWSEPSEPCGYYEPVVQALKEYADEL